MAGLLLGTSGQAGSMIRLFETVLENLLRERKRVAVVARVIIFHLRTAGC